MIRSRKGAFFGRVLLALTAVLAADGAVWAHSLHGGPAQASQIETPDHDDALSARARGEIRSLDEILQILKPKPTDRMVDVVLDRQDGRWIYEVTWLTKVGRYRVFTVDAKDGVILRDETK